MKKKSRERTNVEEWIVEDMPDVDASYDNNIEDSTQQTNNQEIESNTTFKKRKKLKRDILMQRSEASLNISEFNLTEVGKEKIKLNELVKTSLKTTGQVTQKNLQSVKRLKKLSAPLSKQHQEKIKRTVAYEKICDEVTKWESLIQSNRSADQLVFPLKKPDVQLQSLENTVQNFVTKHPVEIAVSELLEKSENKLEPDKPLTAAEEKALQAMSAAEAKARHAELMKHRALISYQEAKARHQNKIKSKRYHRILKKEKVKKAMKEFEQLQKYDAEKALEKLADLDKLRILERMTLKHRNTGKWAKQQKIRAKYNPESRGVLKEDLAVGRQLREKVDLPESVQKTSFAHEESEMNDDDAGLIERANDEDETSDMYQLSSERTANSIVTSEVETLLDKFSADTSKLKKTKSEKCVISRNDVDDIMEFVSKEQPLESAIPDNLTFGQEDIDDMMGSGVPMSEAYGDENYIAEFREEKEAADKAPQGINLYLPGWGFWGGPGIKPSKKQMKRFFIKPPASPPQKKNTLGNVILHEDKDKKAAMHQVSTLPFPFTNIRQFESYIRQPVGHTWNPQSSFQNLVAPKVITKMGKVIEPIDAEDLVLNTTTKKQTHRKGKKRQEDFKAF